MSDVDGHDGLVDIRRASVQLDAFTQGSLHLLIQRPLQADFVRVLAEGLGKLIDLNSEVLDLDHALMKLRHEVLAHPVDEIEANDEDGEEQEVHSDYCAQDTVSRYLRAKQVHSEGTTFALSDDVEEWLRNIVVLGVRRQLACSWLEVGGNLVVKKARIRRSSSSL